MTEKQKEMIVAEILKLIEVRANALKDRDKPAYSAAFGRINGIRYALSVLNYDLYIDEYARKVEITEES